MGCISTKENKAEEPSAFRTPGARKVRPTRARVAKVLNPIRVRGRASSAKLKSILACSRTRATCTLGVAIVRPVLMGPADWRSLEVPAKCGELEHHERGMLQYESCIRRAPRL
jgi:hypothetical protein